MPNTFQLSRISNYIFNMYVDRLCIIKLLYELAEYVSTFLEIIIQFDLVWQLCAYSVQMLYQCSSCQQRFRKLLWYCAIWQGFPIKEIIFEYLMAVTAACVSSSKGIIVIIMF